jgi:peptidoglycan/xylan/chitin deacetylase (PgdA/CDA1 family)
VVSPVWIAIGVLSVVVFFQWLQLQKIRPASPPFSGRQPMRKSQEDTENTRNIFQITSPVRIRGMVVRNRITIEGEADENLAILLLHGDRLLAVTRPSGGKFVFEDVPINRGQNCLTVKAMSPDGEVIALEELTFRYNLPAFSHLVRPFYRGSLRKKVLALTFDGGSENNVSAEILDILRQAGIRCTFFLTGKFVERYPQTVRQIVEEGHEVGNHTYSHPHLTEYAASGRQVTKTGVDREFVQSQLKKMEEVFRELTGRDVVRLWRPPFGEHNREIRSWAAELGYRTVGWTVESQNGENFDTRDWVADPESENYLSAEEIRDMILKAADAVPNGLNGAIILMHLGSHRSSDFPHRKLPEIIEKLRKRGYRFVTVSELINDY